VIEDRELLGAFPTAEVRWFFPGAIPPEIRHWFRGRDGELRAEPGRVDYYLDLPGIDALGIKIREGRIEIKQRTGQQSVVQFQSHIAGLVEHWLKWSLRLASGQADLANLIPPSTWLAVHKERELISYQVVDDGGIVAVSGEDRPGQGCAVELASIRFEGRQWWSLGFEAFGDQAILGENLLRVAAHVLAPGQVPTLSANDSCGYPQWLDRLAEQVGHRPGQQRCLGPTLRLLPCHSNG
jgi:hypothetical protein